MKLMKAQVIEAPFRMVLKDVPIPTISDDEVLIRVKLCGICGSDWGSYSGKYANELKYLPLTTGHEFFGTIEEVGKNARGLEKGDRVAADICIACGTCYYCRRGDALLCSNFVQVGIHTNGGFAEFVKVPWKNCYHVPDEVDDLKAAFIEPLTATIQASRRMGCTLGSSVVVIGCGLGIMHAALAKLRGAAPVIVVGTNPARLAMAKRMAADFVIDTTKTPDAVAEVIRITNGVGADYVLEAVGTTQTYELAFKMLRRGGTLQAFGICADDDLARLPPSQFVLEEKKVSGSCAGIGNDWGDAITLLKYGRIDPTPLISMIVPLSELEVSMKEIKADRRLVKVLVSPEREKRQIVGLESSSRA